MRYQEVFLQKIFKSGISFLWAGNFHNAHTFCMHMMPVLDEHVCMGWEKESPCGRQTICMCSTRSARGREREIEQKRKTWGESIIDPSS
jgi:hypothetical protein